MNGSSFLRLFIHTDKLDETEQHYWDTYINRREHLKREYPDGIPIKVLYPEGLNGAAVRHGSYYINPEGEYYVSIPDNPDCLLPGDRIIPIYWYLLFLDHGSYFRRTGDALHSFRQARRQFEAAYHGLSFNLAEEPSTVYVLKQCNSGNTIAFENYLSGEDPDGYLELIYADFGSDLDPLLLDRLDEDRSQLIFPRLIKRGLSALQQGARKEADLCFEELALLHREYRRFKPEIKPVHREWQG